MDQLELINKLFAWTKTTDLKNQAGETVIQIYQRLVGDSDVQKARLFALRNSRELRLKFRDTTSDEYVALVTPVDDLDHDAILTLLLVDSVDGVKQEIDKTFYFPEPTEPDEYASNAEHEDYAHRWTAWEDERNLAYNKLLVEKMDALKVKLEELDDEELHRRAKVMRIEALCDQELKSKFVEMCVVLGTYADANYQKHLFATYHDFAIQPDTLRSQVLAGYAELEMSTIGLKESTKSQASEQASA